MNPPNSRSPTAIEALRVFVRSHIDEINVALPGRIEEWDAATQKATVKPLVQRNVALEGGEELVEILPSITDVPVMFPRSSGFFVSFPLAKGDMVLLIFCSRSIDKWVATSDGADTNPADFRTHDLSDAIAIPGPYPFARALKEVDTLNMVIGKDEGGLQIHITPDGTMEVRVDGTADAHVAVGEALQTFWDTTYKAWQIAHTHPTGTGPSGPPVQAGTFPAFDTSIISAVLGLKGP